MPTFDLTGPDGATYRLDAPDENAALGAFQKFVQIQKDGFDREDPRFHEGAMSATKAIEGVPIAGALAQKAGAAVSALAHPLTGVGADGGSFSERYAKNLEQEDAASKTFERERPIEATASKLVGGALATAPIAATSTGARVLGLAGDAMLPMLARGAGSGAAIGGLDAAARGENITKGILMGMGHGVAAPVLGKAVGATAQAIGSRLVQPAEANAVASAAERLGVDFPKVAATDNLVTQRAGAALKEMPYLGDPIVKASRTATTQMGDALRGVEQSYGSGSALNAGDVAKTGLSNWITGKSKDVAERLYKAVDDIVDPAITHPLYSTRHMVGTIAAERQQAGLDGAGKAIDKVLDAVTRPSGLNYQGLKTLRTSVGELMNNSVLPADISRTELKRIYGALTNDLRTTVEVAGGPRAAKAFDRANAMNTLISQRREALAKVIGEDASVAPERVMDRLVGFASGNSRADAQKLIMARKAIGKDGWDEVASAAVAKIGRDADGNFSPARFLTAYGKMSPLGKQTLFGSTGRNELVSALEDIATLSRKAKGLDSYGNPSGTGRVLGGLSTAAAAVTHPHVVLPMAAGARMISKMMAAPIRPQSATVQAALKNANVRTLLEHVTGGAALGETPATVGLTTNLRERSQPSRQQIQ